MNARLAVLASGTGTNLQALVDDPVVGPHVALVVSDRPEAMALQRARDRGIRTGVCRPADHADRAAHDRALRDVLLAEDIDCVALAGYMRIVGPELIAAFPERIVNLHPALLPAFPGMRSVADALEWGVKVTGVTVHLVDEQVDHGPIVAQEPVPVRPDDDLDSLLARVHETEHRIFPRAVRALVEGRLKVDGRVVHVLVEEGEG
ncbi:MAG TPA: phosphoribosylglycinamide formyltransferase [Actinomycetota bacterium]|nr:phosphoribosylglycinamide formyltransferase [Actinomycetota bacterium]